MEPLGAAIIFLAICISGLVFLAARRSTWEKGKLPPGPAPLPILGNALQLKINHLPQTLQELGEKYGPVFTIHFGGERVVVLHGYEAIKEALIDRGEEFASRGSLPLVDKFSQGRGIIFSNGERWKQIRRFTLSTLRNFGMGKKSIEERIQEEARYLLEKIQDTKGRPFDPTFLLSPAFSNIICSIVFGTRYEYDDQRFMTLMNYFNENFQVISSPWGQLYNLFPSFMELIPGPHKRVYKNVERVKEFVLEEIKVHESALDPTAPRDFIDCFCIKMDQEKHNGGDSEFTIDNLVMSAVDLFAAGTETSSSTMRYGLLILLKYPEIQGVSGAETQWITSIVIWKTIFCVEGESERLLPKHRNNGKRALVKQKKVQKEIDRVVGRARPPCMADRGQMPYTDAVIHEVQRFISLVPLGLPHAVLRDTPFRQYIIPKGSTVYPLLSSVLYDSREFPNPQEFDPRHFLHQDGHFRKSDFFMPFSTGKRICAGEGLARMELFLFFTTVLQNFTLKPLVHPKDIDLTPEMSSFGNAPRSYQLLAVPR